MKRFILLKMTIFVHHVRAFLFKFPLSERMKRFIDHPAGPLTIFFWCPLAKWMITLANVKDFKRPAENVSMNQQAVIFATGAIWSRYCVVITPVNYSLMTVNMAMAGSALYQIYRRWRYNQEQANQPKSGPIENNKS
mmetsp:Transcript_36246/g.41792  ORF Transcript_36246/g.41792 Transcript_36246/m.41792 type:complete len:137 (-) Transcript_36246:39-449(-)